jgi:hypothetical protein
VYNPNTPLPERLPPTVLRELLAQLVQPAPTIPGAQPGGPVGAPDPNAPPQVPLQGAPQTGPAQPAGPQPPPQQGGNAEQQGLDTQTAEVMRQLAQDPKARRDIEDIIRQVSQDKRNTSRLEIDPARMMALAQGWNAFSGTIGRQIAQQRGQSPGASKASDEALLRIYYTTPMASWSDPNDPTPIEIQDIDDYADAVRVYLVTKMQMTDPEKIEDQVMRECFPLREILIRSGRTAAESVAFVADMNRLTDRWIERYGELPKPEKAVLKATEQGHGDPEAEPRDSDSEDQPA